MTHPVTQKRKGLGQGLSALLDTTHESHAPLDNELAYFNPEQFSTGKYQPRKHFDDTSLDELAESIKARGILHPLIARYDHDGTLELVAGERRLQAAKRAGLKEIPCRILEISEEDALEISLLENVQRKDLSPIEEAKGYERLMQELGYTQESLSEKLGKSRTHLTNTLRLLKLSPDVQKLISDGKLSSGHGRALIGLENAEAIAKKALSEGWSVRQIEKFGRQEKSTYMPSHVINSLKEEEVLAQQLQEMTGLDISVQLKKRGGVIRLCFQTPSELDKILQKITATFSITQ